MQSWSAYDTANSRRRDSPTANRLHHSEENPSATRVTFPVLIEMQFGCLIKAFALIASPGRSPFCDCARRAETAGGLQWEMILVEAALEDS